MPGSVTSRRASIVSALQTHMAIIAVRPKGCKREDLETKVAALRDKINSFADNHDWKEEEILKFKKNQFLPYNPTLIKRTSDYLESLLNQDKEFKKGLKELERASKESYKQIEKVLNDKAKEIDDCIKSSKPVVVEQPRPVVVEQSKVAVAPAQPTATQLTNEARFHAIYGEGF